MCVSKIGGIQVVVCILNFINIDMEQWIMKDLCKEDKDMQILIEENMFVFDNLIKLDDCLMQIFMWLVEIELLVLVFKGVDEVLWEKLFNCMLICVVVNICDEMDVMGLVCLIEVQNV